jgi:hypothetical protein
LWETERFLAAVRESVGVDTARDLRGRRAPSYIVFTRVPRLSFRRDRSESTLRRLPKLGDYRNIGSREVLWQYRQELAARARTIEALTVFATAGYGVVATMVIPPLLKFGWDQRDEFFSHRGLRETWMHGLAAYVTPPVILILFVLLPLIGVAWARRQLRRGEVHVTRIEEVLRSREEATQHIPQRDSFWRLIGVICARVFR